MPVSGTVISPLNLVHVIYTGTVTMAENRAEFVRLYSLEAHAPGFPEICDLSQAGSFDIGFDEMLAFVKYAQAAYTRLGTLPTMIIVAPPHVDQHTADMYYELATSMSDDRAVHVVQGYPEVLALLDLDPSDITHFPEFCRNESHLL